MSAFKFHQQPFPHVCGLPDVFRSQTLQNKRPGPPGNVPQLRFRERIECRPESAFQIPHPLTECSHNASFIDIGACPL